MKVLLKIFASYLFISSFNLYADEIQYEMLKSENITKQSDMDLFLSNNPGTVNMNNFVFNIVKPVVLNLKDALLAKGKGLFDGEGGVIENYSKITSPISLYAKDENKNYGIFIKGIINSKYPKRPYQIFYDVFEGDIANAGAIDPENPGKFYIMDKSFISENGVYEQVKGVDEDLEPLRVFKDNTPEILAFNKLTGITQFANSLTSKNSTFNPSQFKYIYNGKTITVDITSSAGKIFTWISKEAEVLSLLYASPNITIKNGTTVIRTGAPSSMLEYFKNEVKLNFIKYQDILPWYFGYPSMYYLFDNEVIVDLDDIDLTYEGEIIHSYLNSFVKYSSSFVGANEVAVNYYGSVYRLAGFKTSQEASNALAYYMEQENYPLYSKVAVNPPITIVNSQNFEVYKNLLPSIMRLTNGECPRKFISVLDITYRIDTAVAQADNMNLLFQASPSFQITPVDGKMLSYTLDCQILCSKTNKSDPDRSKWVIAPSIQITAFSEASSFELAVICPEGASNKDANISTVYVGTNCVLAFVGENSLFSNSTMIYGPGKVMFRAKGAESEKIAQEKLPKLDIKWETSRKVNITQ